MSFCCEVAAYGGECCCCNTCRGTGEVHESGPYDPAVRDSKVFKCKDCKGTGESK